MAVSRPAQSGSPPSGSPQSGSPQSAEPQSGSPETLHLEPRALQVRGLSKHFSGVIALEGVDLDLPAGGAAGVIGPNGAGKSTLLKLIAGMYRPDRGEVHLGGQRLDRLAAYRVARHGVALAHQVPRPFARLTIRENVRVGAMASRPAMTARQIDDVLELCGLQDKAARPAGSLRVLDLKRLEVARALATQPAVLMLDEVAAGLVGRELDQAIDMIRRVHDTGISLLVVEHIERVVREIVDQVLVLNWGRSIAAGTPADIARNAEVREVYLGHGASTVPARPPRDERSTGTPDALIVSGLTAGYGTMTALHDVSLRVGAGEIVTVLGANGAGKSTLCSAIMGAVRVSSGSVTAFGEDVTSLPVHQRARRGLAHCQEGRRIFAELSVEENLRLGAPLTLGRVELKERLDHVHQTFPVLVARRLDQAGTMSGGQQQMLAVGRALMASPRLLICDEISLGLAPLAIDDLYEALRLVNQAGVAILLVEQNVHRCLELADSAVVLSRGQVAYAGDPSPLRDDAALDAAYFGADPSTDHHQQTLTIKEQTDDART